MDEKSMILEQERQEKAKKRKKRKKYKVLAGILVMVLLIGGSWYVGWGRYLSGAQESDTVEIKASGDQEIVYGKITAINGNEITYAIAEEMDAELPEGREEGTGDDVQRDNGSAGGRGQRGEMPDMESMPEDMSQMFGGDIPDMSEMAEMFGDMDMSQMPDMGNMSGGMGDFGGRGGREQMEGPAQMGSNMNRNGTAVSTDTNMFTYGDNMYMVGEETVTTYIPVGTDVTTKLGTVTTFSRLSAGDCIALVTEEEGNEQMIMAVYIIG